MDAIDPCQAWALVPRSEPPKFVRVDKRHSFHVFDFEALSSLDQIEVRGVLYVVEAIGFRGVVYSSNDDRVYADLIIRTAAVAVALSCAISRLHRSVQRSTANADLSNDRGSRRSMSDPQIGYVYDRLPMIEATRNARTAGPCESARRQMSRLQVSILSGPTMHDVVR